MIRKIFQTLFLAGSLLAGYSAAQTVPQVSTQLLTMPLAQPVQAVAQGSVQVVGTPGLTTYYVWIVANYLVGNAGPSPAFGVSNANPVLSSGNYLSASWTAVPGATSYDVLLTSAPTPPTGACNCAAATRQTGTSYAIQSNSLNSYTVTTFTGSPGLAFNVTNAQSGQGDSALTFATPTWGTIFQIDAENGAVFRHPTAINLKVTTDAANLVPLTVIGATSQSADLEDWNNSGGTTVCAVSANGTINTCNLGALGWTGTITASAAATLAGMFADTATHTGNPQFIGNPYIAKLSAQCIESRCFADGFTGANYGARVQDCFNYAQANLATPICDATALGGAEAETSPIIDNLSPVQLILAANLALTGPSPMVTYASSGSSIISPVSDVWTAATGPIFKPTSGTQPAIQTGYYGLSPFGWTALTTFPEGTAITATATDSNAYQYTWSGGETGATAPTFPTSGTVSDGSGTWTNVGTGLTYACETCMLDGISVNMVSETRPGTVSIAELSGGNNGIACTGSSGSITCTVTSSTAHGLVPTDVAQIAGVTTAGDNGYFKVESVPSTTTYTISCPYLCASDNTGGTSQKTLIAYKAEGAFNNTYENLSWQGLGSGEYGILVGVGLNTAAGGIGAEDNKLDNIIAIDNLGRIRIEGDPTISQGVTDTSVYRAIPEGYDTFDLGNMACFGCTVEPSNSAAMPAAIYLNDVSSILWAGGDLEGTQCYEFGLANTVNFDLTGVDFSGWNPASGCGGSHAQVNGSPSSGIWSGRGVVPQAWDTGGGFVVNPGAIYLSANRTSDLGIYRAASNAFSFYPQDANINMAPQARSTSSAGVNFAVGGGGAGGGNNNGGDAILMGGAAAGSGTQGNAQLQGAHICANATDLQCTFPYTWAAGNAGMDNNGNLSVNSLGSLGTQTILTNSCSATSAVGGATAGQFVAGAVSCSMTFTLPTATNGWNCTAHDITTPADTLPPVTETTSYVVFTGTVVISDKITWSCMSY